MRPVADVIEDAEWLDNASIGAEEAARRLEFPSAHALEKWLERHNRYDLWLRMKRRDPEGLHHKMTSVSTGATPTVDPLAATIARAKKSERIRIRRKAERVEVLLTELTEELRVETETNREQAKARAEVLRLERALAEARSHLKVKSASSTTGPQASDVRAWAAQEGIACPARGRVPADVTETYNAAHRETVA